MIGWTTLLQMREERDTRWLVSGVIRAGEFRAEYLTNAANAASLAARWEDEHVRQVQILPPAGTVDIDRLRALGTEWAAAREAERIVAQRVHAAVTSAAEAGIPETMMADLLGCDRMTVRRALGKR